LTFGATDKSVRLLEEHNVCKLSVLIRKIGAVTTTTAKHPAATPLDLLLGRVALLSKADPWVILFNKKDSYKLIT